MRQKVISTPRFSSAYFISHISAEDTQGFTIGLMSLELYVPPFPRPALAESLINTPPPSPPLPSSSRLAPAQGEKVPSLLTALPGSIDELSLKRGITSDFSVRNPLCHHRHFQIDHLGIFAVGCLVWAI